MHTRDQLPCVAKDWPRATLVVYEIMHGSTLKAMLSCSLQIHGMGSDLAPLRGSRMLCDLQNRLEGEVV